MALTVEDGTGLASADSFVSLADAETYHSDHAHSDWFTATYGTADKEAALRRASRWVSEHFAWKGLAVQGREQALAWPRWDVVDRDGWPVDGDSVPREVVNATCEAALRELVTPGFFTPDVTMTDRVKRERVGPLETEYASVPASADAARPVVTLISDMLRGLTRGGSGLSGRAVRG